MIVLLLKAVTELPIQIEHIAAHTLFGILCHEKHFCKEVNIISYFSGKSGTESVNNPVNDVVTKGGQE